MPEFILNLFVQSIAQKAFFSPHFLSVLDVFVFHVNAPRQMLTVFVSDSDDFTCTPSLLCLRVGSVIRKTTIEPGKT